MSDPRLSRLERTRALLAREGIDALLLGPSADLRHLLGYDPPPLERLTLAVVPAKGEAVLVVPALEAPLAAGHLGSLPVNVVAWQETDDPIVPVRAALVAAGAERGRLAVGDRLWSTFLLRLQKALTGASWVPGGTVTGPLRMVKDTAEVEALAVVAATVDRVVNRLDEWIRPGRTEASIAVDIDRALREEGHDRVNFVIVAAGPNGASPHHTPGSRQVEHGDAVVVDIGGTRDGYCSDTTRTVVMGRIPDGFAELYEVLRVAQAAGCDAVAPGVPAEEIDAACRRVIADAGYGGLFIHRTGHGIGLEEHEDPYLVEGSRVLLEPGMAFSVEPGIYVPGRYGARIEDIVVCTENSGRRLNTTTRALQVL